MNEELARLINTLIEGSTCYLCGTPLEVMAKHLERESDDLFEIDYQCPGCDVCYDIEVIDRGTMISLKAFRVDIEKNSDLAEISRQTRKEALQRESHPVKELVRGSIELSNALTILQVNKERIVEAANTFRREGFDVGADIHRRTKADLHNYMASAYSFEQIVENIEPQLPLGTNIESAKEEFKEEHQIIKGLRTYAQHHLTLPFSLALFYDEHTGAYEDTITVSMDDVVEFDYKDPEISYEEVEGDSINIERRVKLHYNAASDLVNQIFEYLQSEYKEELEDYREATTYEFPE